MDYFWVRLCLMSWVIFVCFSVCVLEVLEYMELSKLVCVDILL